MLSKMSDYFDGHFQIRKYSYLGKKISYFVSYHLVTKVAIILL